MVREPGGIIDSVETIVSILMLIGMGLASLYLIFYKFRRSP
jgi:hypothetical protein